MKQVLFRPLRRVKKTGKIVVASYMQWRKFKLGDNQWCDLVVDTEYRDMPHDEFVYNHKGELLYFYDYNPNSIAIFHNVHGSDMLSIFKRTDVRGFSSDDSIYTNYSGKGIDCDGVPTFSHFDADYLAEQRFELYDIVPLTVGKVIEWYAWIIENMRKTNIGTK